MFNKLLVALDGSEQSERILPLASSLVGLTGGELTLLRVLDDEAEFSQLDAAVRYLAQLSTRLAAEGIGPHTSVVRGDVVEQILGEVARVEADVVVMTTHGRGGLKRALLGSVTEKVLAKSNVPVLAFRPGEKAVNRIRTILVPIDDSAGCALALNAAKHLARAASAQVELLHIVPPLVRFFRGRYIEPEWEERARARAQADMELLAADFEQDGVRTHGRAIVGQVSPTIVEVANEVMADIMVMSTSGLTGLPRAVLGSVADEVLRTSGVPALLIHFDVEQCLAAMRELAEPTVTAPAGQSEGAAGRQE